MLQALLPSRWLNELFATEVCEQQCKPSVSEGACTGKKQGVGQVLAHGRTAHVS